MADTELSFKSYKSLDEIEFAFEYYKDFYDTYSITSAQYENLRYYFKKMSDAILGSDYYNMGMDVYECDRLTCEDITNKAKGFFKRLFRL